MVDITPVGQVFDKLAGKSDFVECDEFVRQLKKNAPTQAMIVSCWVIRSMSKLNSSAV